MDAFRALVVDKHGDQLMADIREVESVHLPEGDVTVEVAYSSLNYKDGLVLNGLGGLVKSYPHVPGIDYAGTVSYSTHPDFTRGDHVIGTGFRVGEVRWGGYAQRVSVSGDWLVSLPQNLSLYRAMCLGSAGLTAAISLRTLEEHGLHPNQGEVLITGASGGVGSFAVSLLAHLGYQVVALTGREENLDYLRQLGAKEILPRSELSSPTGKPLESARWAACIDSVGGPVLYAQSASADKARWLHGRRRTCRWRRPGDLGHTFFTAWNQPTGHRLGILSERAAQRSLAPFGGRPSRRCI